MEDFESPFKKFKSYLKCIKRRLESTNERRRKKHTLKTFDFFRKLSYLQSKLPPKRNLWLPVCCIRKAGPNPWILKRNTSALSVNHPVIFMAFSSTWNRYKFLSMSCSTRNFKTIQFYRFIKAFCAAIAPNCSKNLVTWKFTSRVNIECQKDIITTQNSFKTCQAQDIISFVQFVQKLSLWKNWTNTDAKVWRKKFWSVHFVPENFPILRR